MSEMKRLYLSEYDKKISGVCGGIAEYFNVDSTLVRIIWVIAAFGTAGTGLLAYLVCGLIIPKR